MNQRESAGCHPRKGIVQLVGAGPGDPGLLTLNGLRALEEADVVIYDHLVADLVLDFIPRKCQRIYAGKRAGEHSKSQEEINELLVQEAEAGNRVVRLKGGDPFVFGRGGEESLALRKRGIEFEVIPGVSALGAVPAYAGIPVTHRGLATSCLIVSGHEDPTKPEQSVDWELAAKHRGTLVVFMGARNLCTIASVLQGYGMPGATPAAFIHNGALPSQRTVAGTIADLPDLVEAAGLCAPALLVIGEAVLLRDQLSWYEKRPLFGRRVVVTRARAQTSVLAARLRELGADPVESPSIEIRDTDNPEPLCHAIQQIESYDWLLFTSVNTVNAFFAALHNGGGDSRKLGAVRIAAVGDATVTALKTHGVVADVVPGKFTGTSLAKTLIELVDVAGQRILLPQSDKAPEILKRTLEKHGARVDRIEAYRTVVPDSKELIDLDSVDAVTFTSSSTAESFVKRAGKEALVSFAERGILASIGPVTSARLREFGLPVHVEAEVHTIPGLIEALVSYYSGTGPVDSNTS